MLPIDVAVLLIDATPHPIDVVAHRNGVLARRNGVQPRRTYDLAQTIVDPVLGTHDLAQPIDDRVHRDVVRVHRDDDLSRCIEAPMASVCRLG